MPVMKFFSFCQKDMIKKGFSLMNDKFKNIEFIRVVGCLSIILFHLFCKELHFFFPDVLLYSKLRAMTNCGSKAVDLFFILSGLFFAYKLNTQYSLIDFLKKKIIRFYPVLIFVVIAIFVSSIFKILDFNLYEIILVLTGLSGTGLSLTIGPKTICQFWYVSSMMWVLVLYYYLLKNFAKKNVNLFIACSIFFSYTIIIQFKNGMIGGTYETFHSIVNFGLLRALGGIGIGYFIGEWLKENYSHIINCKTSDIYQKLVMTACEFCCLFFMINNLFFRNYKFNKIVFILDFAALLVLFLLKRGYISQFFETSKLSDIFEQAAKYTYSFYMTHYFVIVFLENTIIKNYYDFFNSHLCITIAMNLTAIFIAGYFTYNVVEKPCANYLKKFAKKINEKYL